MEFKKYKPYNGEVGRVSIQAQSGSEVTFHAEKKLADGLCHLEKKCTLETRVSFMIKQNHPSRKNVEEMPKWSATEMGKTDLRIPSRK